MAATALKAGGFALLAAGLAAPAPPPLTFRDDIAPIVRDKCLPCHQPGGIGPFDFTTYKNFRRSLELIRVQMLSRNMPPTSAESEFGPVAQNSQLTDEELLVFQKFYDAGAPEGEPLDAPIQRADRALKPTLSFASPEIAIEPEGVQFWRAQTFDISKFGRHIQGLWVTPNQPRVLRSAQFYLLPPRVRAPEDGSRHNVFVEGLTPVGNWSPGYPIWQMPQDVSLDMPEGSRILVLAKYQPSGRPEDGGFSLNFKVRRDAAPKTLQVVSFEDRQFELKPDVATTVSLGKELVQGAEIVGLVPQARFFCGAQAHWIESPEGGRRNLLSILKWDPYWLGSYIFEKPVAAGSGTRLNFEFTYYNDERCQVNELRAPTTVRAGEGPEDEVCRMHILIARPR